MQMFWYFRFFRGLYVHEPLNVRTYVHLCEYTRYVYSWYIRMLYLDTFRGQPRNCPPDQKLQFRKTPPLKVIGGIQEWSDFAYARTGRHISKLDHSWTMGTIKKLNGARYFSATRARTEFSFAGPSPSSVCLDLL